MSRVEFSTLAAALDYAARGWPVLALVPGSKVPVGKHDPDQPRGCLSASTDPNVIKRLFDRHRRANVGLATGHVFDVVDYDGPHAVAVAKGHGLSAPQTRTVRTPSGGFHVYITHDPAIPQKARVLTADCDCMKATGESRPCGIDTRAERGFVVAPPSVVDGRRYEVLRDAAITPWPAFVEFCKETARPKLTEPKSARPANGDSLIDQVKGAYTVEELAERLGARLIGHGDQLKAKCPLHGERKGFAFVVWSCDQRWKCFGRCNASGDVIDLYRLAHERGMV